MKNIFIILIFLLSLNTVYSQAKNILGAEIYGGCVNTSGFVGGYIYTKNEVLDTIILSWGDGAYDTLIASGPGGGSWGYLSGTDIIANGFAAGHIYDTAGVYIHSVTPGYLVGDIKNIPDSHEQLITFSDTLVIEGVGLNSVNSKPEFSGSVINIEPLPSGGIFHRTSLWDTDGDDVELELLPYPVAGAFLPSATDSLVFDFLVDHQGLGLLWEKPTEAGRYAFALRAREFRWGSGFYLGNSTRYIVLEITPDMIVSNDDPLIFSTLNLFPNPTQDQLLLQLDDTIGTDELTLEITNLLGQVIHQERVVSSGGQLSVDTSRFPEGSYFLTLRSEGGQVTKGFVVQRQ